MLLFDQKCSKNSNILKYYYNLKCQFSVALFLNPLCIMHDKSNFNALIMPCNAPYNALYNLK